MRSICTSTRRSMAISRRRGWIQPSQNSTYCRSDDKHDQGVDGFASHRIPRRYGGIQPPTEIPFHVRTIHCGSWMERSRFRSRMHSNDPQSRTLFSFLPRDDSENDDWSSTNEKTRLDMPSRQSDHHLLEESQQELQHAKQHAYQLLETPMGDLDWSKLPPLLLTLCESDSTIRYAFDLLDRAAKEDDAKSQMTHEMVHPVVQAWLNAYIAQQKNIDKPHYGHYHHNHNRANASHNRRDDNNNTAKQQRMLSPLNVWKRIHHYQTIGVPLESTTYHKIMEGTTHVKSKVFHNPNGPRLAETILEQMMQESKRKNPLIRPSAHPFTVAMLSWEQAAAYVPLEASAEAPQRALALLHKLKNLYNSGWGSEFMPDKNAYRRVMNIFAHRGDGDQVEALLEDLYALYLDHYEQGHEKSHQLKPTTPFFSLVLYSWSKSKDPGAAERAEAILDRLLDMEQDGEIPTVVQSNFFNIVMVCWSKQRTKESALRVQAIFDRLVEYSKTDPTKQPIGASYMALIKTWSRFDPRKAEAAFWQWKEEHDAGRCEMRIESDPIRLLVSAWCKSKEPGASEQSDRLVRIAMEEPQLEPTTSIFNMVINQWCQEKTLDGLERAQDLLHSMIEYHDSHPGSDTRPNNLTYLPIVRSLAEIGKLERAEELLFDFFAQRQAAASPVSSSKANHLDTRIFNCVLKGWLQQASKMPEASIRAQDILLATQFYGVRPNYASFQYVLDAWRKNKASSPWNYAMEPPKAEAVLALLDHEYGKAETKKELYLNLRKGWKLLAIH